MNHFIEQLSQLVHICQESAISVPNSSVEWKFSKE